MSQSQIKILTAQLEDNSKNLQLAAEFGQLLVRENEKLKESNSELLKEIADEAAEKKDARMRLKKLEISHQKHISQALNEISNLERENSRLDQELQRVRDKSAEKKSPFDQESKKDVTDFEDEESKEDEEEDEDAQCTRTECISLLRRNANLENQLRSEANRLKNLQEQLQSMQELTERQEHEIEEKRRVIQVIRMEKEQLRDKVESGKRQLTERGQLETMVSSLSRANSEYKQELEEALQLVEMYKSEKNSKLGACDETSCVSLFDELHGQQSEQSRSNQNQSEKGSLLERHRGNNNFSPVPRTIKEQQQEEEECKHDEETDDEEDDDDYVCFSVPSEAPKNNNKKESRNASSSRTSFDEDPMFFHFHMMVQTVRINMEKLLGFGTELADDNELSTGALYQRALAENIPFFDYHTFIQNAYKLRLEQRFVTTEKLSPVVLEATKLLRGGAISKQEYDQIVRADRRFSDC